MKSDLTGSGGAVLPSGSHRWQRVDMLRGIAVLLVICHHHPGIPVLQAIGWIGVDLFFVLSGFLVSGLVFDEYRRTRSFAPVRFLIRRGFKIYPSFYTLILVTTILLWITDRTDPIMNYVAELFFFQNYHEGLWMHTWSLAVEEHFYFLLVIVAGLLINFKVGLRWKGFVGICIGVFLLVLFLRWNDFRMLAPGELYRKFPTHLRLDALLSGVLLAGWHRFRHASFQASFGGRMYVPLILLTGFLAFVKISQSVDAIGYVYGLTAAYLASMVAVGLCVGQGASGEVRGLWTWLVRPIAWVGRISYNTYLWHLLVILVVEQLFERIGTHGSFMEFATVVGSAVLVGVVATKAIEQPFLRMRERMFPAKSR